MSADPFGSLLIIEFSSRSPESKNNLPNFQNVDGFLSYILFSLTFLVFFLDFLLLQYAKAQHLGVSSLIIPKNFVWKDGQTISKIRKKFSNLI